MTTGGGKGRSRNNFSVRKYLPKNPGGKERFSKKFGGFFLQFSGKYDTIMLYIYKIWGSLPTGQNRPFGWGKTTRILGYSANTVQGANYMSP